MADLIDLGEEFLGLTARVWHDGWHEAHASIAPAVLTQLRTLEDFERRLKARAEQVRLAVDGDAVLGFTIVEGNELYQMYVAEAVRGKGVAQQLMADALERMRAGGFQTAWLACAIGNTRAAAFYEKMGWRLVGEETVALETSAGPFHMTVWRLERAD